MEMRFSEAGIRGVQATGLKYADTELVLRPVGQV